MRWIIDAARARKGVSSDVALAEEILAAIQKRRDSYQRNETILTKWQKLTKLSRILRGNLFNKIYYKIIFIFMGEIIH